MIAPDSDWSTHPDTLAVCSLVQNKHHRPLEGSQTLHNAQYIQNTPIHSDNTVAILDTLCTSSDIMVMCQTNIRAFAFSFMTVYSLVAFDISLLFQK